MAETESNTSLAADVASKANKPHVAQVEENEGWTIYRVEATHLAPLFKRGHYILVEDAGEPSEHFVSVVDDSAVSDLDPYIIVGGRIVKFDRSQRKEEIMGSIRGQAILPEFLRLPE